MTDINNKDWREAHPGDVILFPWYSTFESSTIDAQFNIGHKPLYCLCIGRITNTTKNGLVVLKVYFMTPHGVGYKRLNVAGIKEKLPERQWTEDFVNGDAW